jgi:hypothetical protein
MNEMPYVVLIRNVAIAHFAIGALVCLVHPKIIRDHIATLKDLDVGIAGFVLKPVMALVAFLIACILWPIAWFNAARRERKTRATLERLRAFHELSTAMRAPVRYAGGDGTTLEQAVILQGALLSGPRAEHDFLGRHFPGYEFRRQFLKEQHGRRYDVLEFTAADGETRTIYFDISGNFGLTNVTKTKTS